MPKPPCPWCGASTSVVYRSQRRAVIGSDGYQRRRQCGECGRDWPTIEVLDRDRFTREIGADPIDTDRNPSTSIDTDRRRRG
jgi:transcriptional regulator NrdR family protein